MKEIIFKYFKTVFLCILIINFITGIYSFANNFNSYLQPSKIKKNPTDSTLITQAKDIEKELNELIDNYKNTYGENYPALGIIYYRSIMHYSSVNLIQNFLFGLIAGFGLGNIIYFIFIEKYKKYKLFIALVLALLVTSFFLSLTDILTSVANGENYCFSVSEFFWNMETTSIPYIIVSLLLIAIQKIYSTYIEIKNS